MGKGQTRSKSIPDHWTDCQTAKLQTDILGPLSAGNTALGTGSAAGQRAVGQCPPTAAVLQFDCFPSTTLAIKLDEEIINTSSSGDRPGTKRDEISANVNSQIAPGSIKNYL